MSLKSYRTVPPNFQIAVALLATVIVAGCASTPPSGRPAAAPGTEAGPTSASTAPIVGGDMASRIAAMRQRTDTMRSQLDAMGSSREPVKPGDMAAMMQQMPGLMEDMQSMVDQMGKMSPSGMQQEDMTQMQQLMADMEAMTKMMREQAGNSLPDANTTMELMMGMMKAMHTQLDERSAATDPHHPTPSPTAGG